MLSINVSELVLTIASFFVLLLLLDKLLYKPITGFMEQRSARIREGLEQGREAEQRLEQERGDSQSRLESAKKQGEELIAQAKLKDEKSLAETARALSDRERSAADSARREADSLRQRQSDELAGMKDKLAELLADRLLSR